MEQTLHALAGILQKSIPTIILLLVLYFYLKSMLFGPMAKMLKQREELTTGARDAAHKSLAEAQRKTQEFEAKLREARGEVFREQEETRKKWLGEQAAQLAEARERSAQAIQKAKNEIGADVQVAREGLAGQANMLADQIASAILARKA